MNQIQSLSHVPLEGCVHGSDSGVHALDPGKRFLPQNGVADWAFPLDVQILFSPVYIGKSSVAFKAAKYVVLYKRTKLANNCLMTA